MCAEGYEQRSSLAPGIDLERKTLQLNACSHLYDETVICGSHDKFVEPLGIALMHAEPGYKKWWNTLLIPTPTGEDLDGYYTRIYRCQMDEYKDRIERGVVVGIMPPPLDLSRPE